MQRTLCISFSWEPILQSRSFHLGSGIGLGNGFTSLLMVASIMMSTAHAQSLPSTVGTVITLSAVGEVKQRNDVAHVTLRLEEQDKDRSAAVSRLNQKMKQGTALIKRDDPTAVLTTRGYGTIPVYPDLPQKSTSTLPQPIGWRVSQSLDIVTANLPGLPVTIANAQALFLLQGVSFSLSEPAARKLDEERIQITYRHLLERIAVVTKSMGRSSADATIESIDVDAAGNIGMQQKSGMAMSMMRGVADSRAIDTPDFEPGETTLSSQISAKVRLK